MDTQVDEHPTAQAVIRPASEGDLLALEWNGEFSHFRQLYRQVFEQSQTGHAIMWVAEHPNSGIIGQVFIQFSCNRLELANGVNRAYLFSFKIKPEYRCAGLGTRMMDVVEEDLRRRGFAWLTLNVAKDNPRARGLYERRGYRVVADEPGEWSYLDQYGHSHHVHEPAWTMEKHL